MKMLVRLRYLLEEGFEIGSISGYDDPASESNARLTYVETFPDGSRQLRSENFSVNGEEMEKCSNLFLEYRGRNGTE